MQDRIDDAPPDALNEAYRSLIVDIMYHAIKDRRESDESPYRFADEDHESFCCQMGFESGQEEIECFARSKWFERLTIELRNVRVSDLRDALMGKDLRDFIDLL